MAWKCHRCGNCCRVEGYVRLRSHEAALLAQAMGIPEREFVDKYTRLTRDRQCLSLVEKTDGSCVFLSDDNECGINDSKPLQCQNFPAKWNFDGYESVCQGVIQAECNKNKKEECAD